MATTKVTADVLADTLDLSGKSITLAAGEIGASELAATLDLSGKSVTLAAGEVGASELAATLDLSGKTLTLPAANRSLIVQQVNTQTGAVATGSTAIPFDDTIPENDEGDEYMTLAITPTSATNKLKIDVVFGYAVSALAQVAVALFQDSTVNALAAMAGGRVEAAGVQDQCTFTHYMTAGTTSETTFKVRAGPSAGTLSFNGSAGTRRFGGVMASSITITEIRV